MLAGTIQLPQPIAGLREAQLFDPQIGPLLAGTVRGKKQAPWKWEVQALLHVVSYNPGVNL